MRRSHLLRALVATLLALGGLGLLVAQATADRDDRRDRERGDRDRDRGARAPAISDYIVPGDNAFPEGIAVTRRGPGAQFFVSSVGTGAIFRGTPRDATLEEFLPAGGDGRTSTVGLAIDPRGGRLFVAGGESGTIWVYRIRTKQLLARFETGAGGFVNDIDVNRRGEAYATDSIRPVVFKITRRQVREAAGASVALAPFITFGPEAEYGDGFNANGIVAGRRLAIVVNSRVGKLLRVDLRTGTTTQVDLGGALVTNGDGLVRRGRWLLVIRNADARIDVVRLSRRATVGRVVRTITDPRLRFPTTGELLRGRLLVVNGQLDQRGGSPVLPFTVSVVTLHRR